MKITQHKLKRYITPETVAIYTEPLMVVEVSKGQINDPTQPGGTTGGGPSGTVHGNPSPGSDGAKYNPWSSWDDE